MPTVAVSHTENKHRSFEGVYELVCDALDRLGGFEAYVRPGQTVLIKPDQSTASFAEGGSTTDPLLVGALVRLARYAGAAKVRVGASSAGFLNSLECMQATGMAAMAEQEGAEIIDLGSNQVPNREVHLAEGRVLHDVSLPVPLLETDVIIAVPKAKTDYLDTIRGAMELCAGAVNQGWRAVQMREEDLIERYADIMTVLRPDLSIVDALICGEGDGPYANLPRWCGCILASADPVAMDFAIARLLGRDGEKLRFAAAMEERGVGNKKPIVFLGTPLERVAVHAWPAHEGVGYLPVKVLVGKGVTEAGTIGHVKSAVESLVRQGLLQQALRTIGSPTIMIGDVDDPEFERRIQEGPYIVLDDAARPEYKNDPRVFFVPGHPVLHEALKELTRILRVEEADGFGGQGTSRVPQRAAPRGVGVTAISAALAGLAVGGMLWMTGSGKRT